MSISTPWADRLFERFTALYGASKMANAWPAEGAHEARQAWEEQLRRFSPVVIRKAIQSLIDTAGEWPPTLPQFVGTCREFNRQEQSPALPAPSPTNPAMVAQQLGKVADIIAKPPGHDFMRWARYPRSEHAVRLLLRGAANDQRLRDILRQHLANDGAQCETVAATAEVMAVKASPPAFMGGKA